jgi:N,N-dimethylformamidase beta subunit-like protein
MATVYLWLLITSCVIFLSISYGSSFVANSASGLTSPGFILRDPVHLKLAFLNPTFTYAAYQNNSFYTFYAKYYPITGPSSNVISDLSLIKNKKIPHAPFYLYNQAAGGQPGIPDKHFIDRIVDTVALLAPKSNITFINDQDIEYGKLFYPNGKNAFDVIFLVHEEYVTQTGYNSLKRFVSQGGTLVFTESNVLTVEVKYNHQNDSITLVKGHQFEFDGKVAKRSVEERWKNETSQWLGSNFLPQFKAAYCQ